MDSNTLDERSRDILAALDGRRLSVPELASEMGTTQSELDERLDHLLDNGLVGQDEGGYELRESGRRVLEATAAESTDDRLDVPPAIDRRIEAFPLRADEKDAIRATFAVLQYWGDATTAELVDGAYSEVPVGYDTPSRWWEFVEERLAALPAVDVEPSDHAEWWSYDGRAVVDTGDGDGRAAGSETDSLGSVRHAIERQELSEEESTAARVAFAVIYERGRVSAGELADAAYDEFRAGYASTAEWTNWLRTVFEQVPALDRAEGDETGWVYDPSFRGP